MIELLSAEDVTRHRAALSALLRDAVDSGASIGFLPPLAEAEADAYWRGVVAAVREGSCLLLVARDAEGGADAPEGGADAPERGADATEGEIVGTAQLLLATRPNALHRAEVAKVIVHTKVRRRGIGHALMLAVEERARRLGRTTLVLDTRQGDPSERLYTSVGYRLAGAIPAYAKSADGALDPSAFYYRLLTEGGPS